jgi:hypothetical protein
LNQIHPPTQTQPALPNALLAANPPAASLADRALSFKIQPKSAATPVAASLPLAAENATQEPVQLADENLSQIEPPTLPYVNAPHFTSQRQVANPALAINLLKEIETIVSQWQRDLQEFGRQIEALYEEGPIVDGWLESYAQENVNPPDLRHVELECLMDYIEQNWSAATEADLAADATTAAASGTPVDATPTGYRLCRLTEDGQLWFCPCPAEQVAVVSLAIARYQKLRQLLTRKQAIEARFGQLAETLVGVHRQLG